MYTTIQKIGICKIIFVFFERKKYFYSARMNWNYQKWQ